MSKPWWLRLPMKLSRLAFAFVLVFSNSIVKKCQYCGSWRLKIISYNDDTDRYRDIVQCLKCGATCNCDEKWERVNF